MLWQKDNDLSISFVQFKLLILENFKVLVMNRCSGNRESCRYSVFFAGARAFEKMRPEMRATKAMSALPPLSLGRMASPETQ